jgi:hypothetical protein
VTHGTGTDLRSRLSELIAAIDRRVSSKGSGADAGITADAAALRQQAQERIAELDSNPHGR